MIKGEEAPASPDGYWDTLPERKELLQTRSAYDDISDVYHFQKMFGDRFYATSQRLFGSKELPPEINKLVELRGSIENNLAPASAWNEKEAKETLNRVYDKLIADSAEPQRLAYEAYRNQIHEQEAWAVGESLKPPKQTKNPQSDLAKAQMLKMLSSILLDDDELP